MEKVPCCPGADRCDFSVVPLEWMSEDMASLALVLSILQLSTVDDQATDQPIFQAALAALKAISDQLEERVEQQGWGEVHR
jgi:hypothetical protein